MLATRKQKRRRWLTRKSEPERRCIATGRPGTKDDLIRFVLSPDGEIAPDFSGDLPGRGAWVSATRDSVELAVKKGAFARSFKASARPPENLADRIDAWFVAAACDALGLARRAGDAIVGFEKVREGLERGRFVFLVAACDGAADGRGKLAAKAGATPIISALSRTEIGRALGFDDAVHVGLKPGGAADRVKRAGDRLARYRSGAIDE